jgi:hypothetical protein
MREVIFVASSVKNQKSCVAAIDVETGEFYRIVDDENGKEIDWSDYKIVKGSKELTFDSELLPFVAKIYIKKRVPLNYQPENVIIGKVIFFERRADVSELEEYVSSPNDLWGRSSGFIEYSEDLKVDNSLYLIKANLMTYWKDRIGYKPQRRSFLFYKGIYDLPITDPEFEDLKVETLKDKYVVVSLGEPFLPFNSDTRKCYKIIAKIFK